MRHEPCLKCFRSGIYVYVGGEWYSGWMLHDASCKDKNSQLGSWLEGAGGVEGVEGIKWEIKAGWWLDQGCWYQAIGGDFEDAFSAMNETSLF